MNKNVKHIYAGSNIMLGDAPIIQPIPDKDQQFADPFLLLHHGIVYDRFIDVPPHPHRGFEPITFVYEGAVQHKDSLGNEQIVQKGGVQWITAGSGLMHSEGTPRNIDIEKQEIVQLWVNLPANLKLTAPNYQFIEGNEKDFIHEGDVKYHVVSGEFKGIKGKINSITGITSVMFWVSQANTVTMPLKEYQKSLLYQLSGKVRINGETYTGTKLIEFEEVGKEVEVEFLEPGKYLLLEGHPIKEKVSQWGPYVMNSQTEIMQALADFEQGKMGYLTH